MSSIPSPAGPGHEMSLLGHLEELRVRLTRMVLAAIVGFGICFAFAERILQELLRPLQQVLPQSSTIQATELTEKFFVSMKAAFVGGIFLVSPYLFYQIWSFIAPGLYEEERKLAIPVAFFTALCFVSGACFGYFIVFPYGFTFLANYAADIVTLNPKLSDYYSMALGLLFAFGIIFEMPVFIFFLARFGIVDHKWLRKQRRWAIVIIFIVAAVICPNPDVVSMLLMAAPMVVLYEISIWVAYFLGKKPKKDEENLPATTDGADAAPSSEGGPPATATDAALDEAQASEAPALAVEGEDKVDEAQKEAGAAPDAPAGTAIDPATAPASETPTTSVAPAVPDFTPEEAERQAHETAALGHDAEPAEPAKHEADQAKAPEEPHEKK